MSTTDPLLLSRLIERFFLDRLMNCVIHAMSVHGFTACRSSISRHAGHRFQAMSVHRFTACRSSS